MAKTKLTLRNFRIRQIVQRTAEGNSFVTAACSADATKEFCELMGWNILSAEDHIVSGVKSIKLEGTLETEGMLFRKNGLKRSDEPSIECVVSRCESFGLFRHKGDIDGVIVTEIRFGLVSLAWRQLMEHFGMLGTVDGVATFSLAKQNDTLFNQDQPAEGEEGEEKEATDDTEGDEPAELPKNGRKVKFGTLASRLAVNVNKAN